MRDMVVDGGVDERDSFEHLVFTRIREDVYGPGRLACGRNGSDEVSDVALEKLYIAGARSQSACGGRVWIAGDSVDG